MKLQEAIVSRRTLKVMSSENIIGRDISEDVLEILEMGNSAPFHYINSKSSEKELDSLAPWRFYVLNGNDCNALASYIEENNIAGGKIIDMLKAAQSLIQVSWTPEPLSDAAFLEQSINIEHIAATSAAVQNMLLTATALGYENYWSSGGVLKEDRFKTKLDIPLDEQLLASVFLFDSDTSGLKIKKGALKGRQGSLETCSKRVML